MIAKNKFSQNVISVTSNWKLLGEALKVIPFQLKGWKNRWDDKLFADCWFAAPLKFALRMNNCKALKDTSIVSFTIHGILCSRFVELF
jgi:hypothetical protein